jgi:lipopolysaccharide transport system ATP-binding protein
MVEAVLRMDRVSKRFRKGELHDSLRDLVPALARRLVGRSVDEELGAREFWALRDVSFEVARGEAFGIIGPNGAGKSTILKLLSGIMEPTRGSLEVRGRLSALIEVGAGFHPDLTGRENIFLNGTILGLKRREIRERLDSIVEFSGLADFLDTPVKRYSSGMYARLGFSVAAHVNPDILVVDEVLSVGDYAFQAKCAERMRAVVDGGSTVLFVSHNLRAVSGLCARTLLLDRGSVVAIGSTNEAIRRYMDLASAGRSGSAQGSVAITKVTLRAAAGESVRFTPGERAWVDIEVAARTPEEKLSIAIDLKDDGGHPVFDTSTERLTRETFSLAAGEKRRCTFELTMHLASGTFHLGVKAHRHDIGRTFDSAPYAATFYVHADQDVRGAANLYPRVVEGGNGR